VKPTVQTVVHEYDPLWPEMFEREAERIRGVLGMWSLRIEQAGSTSVSGPAAKRTSYVPGARHRGESSRVFCGRPGDRAHAAIPALVRVNAADREIYARTKAALVREQWRGVQDYAAAKSGVIQEIMERARYYLVGKP
jgi:GrpB-like predicted nucleotidyltransferase (UPF0157 family)